jgi:hypothetical protein
MISFHHSVLSHFEMDSNSILSDINILKAELVQLRDDVKTSTGEREHDLNQRITATLNSLTELYKRLPLPSPSSGNLLLIYVDKMVISI